MRRFFSRFLPRRKTHLFRAVSEAEYEDILSQGRFRNPVGLECKYFARTRQQAEAYARLATSAYGEGPFLVVRATIERNLIRGAMCAEVENRIEVIIIPTEILSAVSKPLLVGRVSGT